MAPTSLSNQNIHNSHRMRMGLFMCFAVALAMVMPDLAFAQANDGGTTQTACTFFTTVSNVLNAVSILVVTIAVMFTGYKVAFAHARISECMPVMIGAILIGAAAQIANLFLTNSSKSNGAQACSGSTTTSLIMHSLDHYASVAAHMLQHIA